MIKLLDDLLIAAPCNPNVPGAIVAGLRQVLDEARAQSLAAGTKWPEPPTYGNPSGTPGAKVDISRLGMRPSAAAPHSVCVAEHVDRVGITRVVGEVLPAGPNVRSFPDHWLPCDADGWIDRTEHQDPALLVRHELSEGGFRWRPLPPKPSALDEMAEQVRRWAAPTRSRDPDHDLPTRECAAPGYTGPFRYEAAAWDGGQGVSDKELNRQPAPALAVQEGGSHYKGMKIQPVEYIHANGLGYFEGNVVKYVSRWRAKGGLQDLKKARHYLDLLIELEGGTK